MKKRVCVAAVALILLATTVCIPSLAAESGVLDKTETSLSQETELLEEGEVRREPEMAETSAKPVEPEAAEEEKETAEPEAAEEEKETAEPEAAEDEKETAEPEVTEESGLLEEEADAIQGKCGASATWKLSGKEGAYTLTISGSGAMTDYEKGSDAPWYSAYRRGIKKLVIGNGITYLGDNCFESLQITELTIPGSVKQVGKDVFNNCGILQHVVLEKGIEEIGEGMFLYCFGLETIEIPNGVKSIGDRAFLSDMKLKEISFPKSLEKIGAHAFSGCTALDGALVLGRNFKEFGTDAFNSCTQLDVIVMKGDPPVFGDDCFKYMKVHAYYPKSNGAWTSQIRGRYGAKTLIWYPLEAPKVYGTWPANNEGYYDHSMKQFRIRYEETVEVGDGWVELIDVDNAGRVLEKIHVAINPEEDEATTGNLINYNEDNQSVERSILQIDFETELEPGHRYAVKVGEDVANRPFSDSRLSKPCNLGGYSDEISSSGWSFRTIPVDYMHVRNIDETIPDTIYDTVFKEKKKAEKIQKRDDGTGGTCFGWSYLVGAAASGFRGASKYTGKLYRMEDDELKEYIQTVHLVQYTKSYEAFRKNEGKKEQLYDAIKGHINGTGNKIVINVHKLKGWGKTGGHALYPVRILSETADEMRVQVLDCNKRPSLYKEFGFNNTADPMLSDADAPLVLKLKNKKVTGFDYRGEYSYSIDFNIIDDEADEVYEGSAVPQPDLIFSITPLSDPLLTELLSVGAPESSEYLYWTEKDSYTMTAPGNASVGITDGSFSAEVSVSSASSVTVGKSGRLVCVNAGGTAGTFSAVFGAVDQNGSSKEIRADSGTASSFSMENTGAGYLISAPDRQKIIFTSGKRTAEVDLPAEQVLICFEGDSVNVYTDHNGDGEFETKADVIPLKGDIPVTGFEIAEKTAELPATKTLTLTQVFSPADATNRRVIWTSSNPKAAEVDENGVIRGKTVGNTVINGTTEDGAYKASCKVNVLFSDVTDKKLANFNAIYSLVQRNVIAGFKNGEFFAPNSECTRAQVVLFLWRAAGKPKAKATALPFRDSADIETMAADYKKAILWANEKGIAMGFTSGKNKGKFLPNDSCTRAQIVLFLYRFAGKPAVGNATVTFKDKAEITQMAPDYTKAILWAISKKITQGYGDKTFRPNRVCTRGECATFLYRQIG